MPNRSATSKCLNISNWTALRHSSAQLRARKHQAQWLSQLGPGAGPWLSHGLKKTLALERHRVIPRAEAQPKGTGRHHALTKIRLQHACPCIHAACVLLCAHGDAKTSSTPKEKMSRSTCTRTCSCTQACMIKPSALHCMTRTKTSSCTHA